MKKESNRIPVRWNWEYTEVDTCAKLVLSALWTVFGILLSMLDTNLTAGSPVRPTAVVSAWAWVLIISLRNGFVFASAVAATLKISGRDWKYLNRWREQMLCHHEALMEMKWNRLLVEESEECILLVCSETCENHNVKILARRVISSVRSCWLMSPRITWLLSARTTYTRTSGLNKCLRTLDWSGLMC